MKALIFLLLTCLSITNILKEPLIKVIRTSSDQEIKDAEQQLLKEHGIKTEIKVMSRNLNGEITKLRCSRFEKDKRTSFCESENFETLLITHDGCIITELSPRGK